MKKFLSFFFVASLAACDNSGKVKADVDTTVNDVKNSKIVDSVEAKGGRILDTMRNQGQVLLDSARKKTDRATDKLLEKAEKGIHDLRRKDSVR